VDTFPGRGKPFAEAQDDIDYWRRWFNDYAKFDRRIESDIVHADKPTEQI
jgi:hypothetical protein